MPWRRGSVLDLLRSRHPLRGFRWSATPFRRSVARRRACGDTLLEHSFGFVKNLAEEGPGGRRAAHVHEMHLRRLLNEPQVAVPPQIVQDELEALALDRGHPLERDVDDLSCLVLAQSVARDGFLGRSQQ